MFVFVLELFFFRFIAIACSSEGTKNCTRALWFCDLPSNSATHRHVELFVILVVYPSVRSIEWREDSNG